MDNPLITIAIIIFSAALAILAIRWLARRGGQVQAAQEARLAAAQAARAVVLEVGKSVPQVRNGTVIVKLRLDVRPPAGESFQATTAWEVQQTALPQVQAQKTLRVKIDAADPRRIYPATGWAEFSVTYWQNWVVRGRD